MKRPKRPFWLGAGIFIALIAAIGIKLLLGGQAATPPVSFESESGVVNGAQVTDLSAASGGKAITFASGSAAASAPCGWTATAPARYKHVIWLWEENKDASSVVGAAPYFDSLSAKCAAAVNVQDSATTIALTSEPQYAAGTSGSNCNQGITSNLGTGTGCILNNNDGNSLSTKSIFQLVKESGGTWKSYQEGMQSNCAQTTGGTAYAFKHNPAAFYSQIRADCALLDVPIPAISCSATKNGTCSTPTNEFTVDIASGSLPTFAFVTPNLTNDMHDGTVAQGDNWLKTYLQLILAGPNYRSGDTAVFIMWDEGSANTGTTRQIPTTVIAPSITPGTIVSTLTNNIGLLRTTQEILGLSPFLGCASGTPPGGTGACNPGSNVSIRTELNL